MLRREGVRCVLFGVFLFYLFKKNMAQDHHDTEIERCQSIRIELLRILTGPPGGGGGDTVIHREVHFD